MRLSPLLLALPLLLGFSSCKKNEELPLRSIIQAIPYEVSLSVEPFSDDKKTAQLNFYIRKDGELIDITAEGHHQVIHVSVTSENLQDFGHYFEEIESFSTGHYAFAHTFTEGGRYQIIIDIADLHSRDHHGEKSVYRGIIDITRPGNPSPIASEKLEYDSGDVAMKLSVAEDFWPQLLSNISVDIETNEPLVEDVDHYYVVSSPLLGEYRLQHVDHRLSDEDTLALHRMAFPEKGPYLIWMKMYFRETESDGTFILNVPDFPRQ